MVTLRFSQLEIPPGQRITLRDVSWQAFEAILAELGENRSTRLAYSNRTLEIVAPLPEHEVAKVMIGDLVKLLLEALDIDCESYGSTTFKRQDMEQGIEPDDCFYIQNAAQMIGRERIDLLSNPPPDLAIEIDITSKTQLAAYEALGVPELWRYENRQLRIDLLQNGKYIQSDTSPTFPGLPIPALITETVNRSRIAGRSQALREFRQRLAELLS